VIYMFEYLKDVINLSGVYLVLFVILLIWSSVWKFLALWKSARKNSVGWFVLFAIINTMGILEILYIFIFSEMKKNNFRAKKVRKRR
jgi:hypothetical protein